MKQIRIIGLSDDIAASLMPILIANHCDFIVETMDEARSFAPAPKALPKAEKKPRVGKEVVLAALAFGPKTGKELEAAIDAEGFSRQSRYSFTSDLIRAKKITRLASGHFALAEEQVQ